MYRTILVYFYLYFVYYCLYLCSQLVYILVNKAVYINLSCLFNITARQVNSEVALAVIYYINTPSLTYIFLKE